VRRVEDGPSLTGSADRGKRGRRRAGRASAGVSDIRVAPLWCRGAGRLQCDPLVAPRAV